MVAEVDEELIAEVLATATGIPVFKLTEEESSRLVRMEEALHKRVIGQDDAIKALSQAIRRTRAGLKDPKRPGGSFIFAGPSGVGKTELSKALAEFLFGDEDALIQLDMSEFGEKHTVSRLFGSPPGFVGYEEGGQLTEKVRRKPFSVVLFDEIEKAHPRHLQLAAPDAGGGPPDRRPGPRRRLQEHGDHHDHQPRHPGHLQGPARASRGRTTPQTTYDRMKAKVNEELKQHFRPEFLNRVDDTIVFPQLTQKEIIAIVDLMVARLDERLKDRDMGIELSGRGQEDPRRAGLRPGAGRPAAAPDDPARDRRRPVGEDPLRRTQVRPDRHRRRGRRRRRRQVHLPRCAEAAGTAGDRRGGRSVAPSSSIERSRTDP